MFKVSESPRLPSAAGRATSLLTPVVMAGIATLSVQASATGGLIAASPATAQSSPLLSGGTPTNGLLDIPSSMLASPLLNESSSHSKSSPSSMMAVYRPSYGSTCAKAVGLEGLFADICPEVNQTMTPSPRPSALNNLPGSSSSMHTGLSSNSGSSQLSTESTTTSISIRSKGPSLYESRREPSKRPTMREEPIERVRIWSASNLEPRDPEFWGPWVSADPDSPKRDFSAIAVENEGVGLGLVPPSSELPNPHSPRYSSQAVPSSIWLYTPIDELLGRPRSDSVDQVEVAERAAASNSLAVPTPDLAMGPSEAHLESMSAPSPNLIAKAPAPPNTPENPFSSTQNNSSAVLDLDELEHRTFHLVSRSPQAQAQLDAMYAEQSRRNVSERTIVLDEASPFLLRAPPSTPANPPRPRNVSSEWYMHLIRNPHLKRLTGEYGQRYATYRMKLACEHSSERVQLAWEAQGLASRLYAVNGSMVDLGPEIEEGTARLIRSTEDVIAGKPYMWGTDPGKPDKVPIWTRGWNAGKKLLGKTMSKRGSAAGTTRA